MTDLALNLALFAEKVLRRPLWPHQLEVANSSAFITALAKARRTGGTVTAETMAIHTAFANRGCRVLVLSATENAARRLTESIGATLARSHLTRGAVVLDNATRIRLTNGSEIVSLPASPRQVRGYGEDVLLVILDEASYMWPELWQAAHYTALDERANGSRLLLLGTPYGATDHFFRRAFEDGQTEDADYASFHWTYKVNPDLDHAYLERQRDRMAPAEYAAEVLGEWSDAEGSLISHSLLQRQTVPFDLPRLDELAPPAKGIAGVDWGASFDRSAVAVVHRMPVQALNPDVEWKPRFVASPYMWNAGAPLTDVVREVAEPARRGAFAYLSPEANGIGEMPCQELRQQVQGGRGKWNRVYTTNRSKTAAYGAILALLEREQLFLPNEPDLLRQLAGLRFEHGNRGFTKIAAEDAAVHDDISDALALASVPYTPSGSARVVCRLLQLASPRAPVPDADLGNFEGDVIEAPSGLRVFTRPPLQSVQGQGLTLPPRSTGPTEPRRLGRFRIEGKTR